MKSIQLRASLMGHSVLALRHKSPLLHTIRPGLAHKSLISHQRRQLTYKINAIPGNDDDDIDIDGVLPDDAILDDDLGDFNIDDLLLEDAEEEADMPDTKSTGVAAAPVSRRSATLDDAEAEAALAAAAAAAELNYPKRPVRIRKLADLLRAAGYTEQAEAVEDIDITNIITCNSEKGGDGSLYVCVPDDSSTEDGHDWAEAAVEDIGAVAVIAQRSLPDLGVPVIMVDNTLEALGRLAAEFYDHPSHSDAMTTVTFVGSYGKTSAAWLARGLFEESNSLVGMVGSIDYALGEHKLTREGDIWLPDPKVEDATLERDCSAPFHITPYQGKYEPPGTTPDALHLQKTLSGISDRGADVAILEVCPSAAADGRVALLHSDVLVFTNVDEAKASQDPEGKDGYIERILSMFEGLDEDQVAVINLDDPYGPMVCRLATSTPATVITYSTSGDPTADVVAEKIKATTWDTEIAIKTPVGALQIIHLQVGSFNVSNVLAAVCVGLGRGVELTSIVAGIEAVEIVPGRCELIDEGQNFPVIVDSASSPQQLSKLVDDIKEAGARRTVLVFGCPGHTSSEYRAAMTQMAHYKADVVIFTNDDPGTQYPSDIISDMMGGLPDEILGRHAGSYYTWLQDPKRVPQWFEKWLLQYQTEVDRYIIEDRFSAIRVAIGLARKSDVVLVTGKGDRDYQLYWDGLSPREDPDTIKGWFDDRVECRNALSRLPYLDGLKDLDRNAVPWTRYPEEREAATVETEASLDQYLKSAVEEIREGLLNTPAGEYEDFDDDDDDDEDDE